MSPYLKPSQRFIPLATLPLIETIQKDDSAVYRQWVKYPFCPLLLRGLLCWAKDGTVPGSFLEAILKNNLFRAIRDDHLPLSGPSPRDIRNLPTIIRFIEAELPPSSHGSPRNYYEWHDLFWRYNPDQNYQRHLRDNAGRPEPLTAPFPQGLAGTAATIRADDIAVQRHSMKYQFSPHLVRSLLLWANGTVPPGKFLRLVLQNNLSAVMKHESPDRIRNLRELPAIIRFIKAELPPQCCGSNEHYIGWLFLFHA